MLNITTQLKEALFTAYNAKGYNDICFAQVLNHSVIESHDDSSTQVLTISFKDKKSPYNGNNFDEDKYYAASIAEDLQNEATKILTKIFETNLKDFKESRIETCRTAAVTIIAGYQYPEQVDIFATILCSDETLHITVMTYPQ